jgi:hypothetical protein
VSKGEWSVQSEKAEDGNATATRKTISRKDFLKGVAAFGAVTAGGCSALHHQDLDELDALQHREYKRLEVFTSWLAQEGASGYIGEMNWPNDKNRGFGDEEQWNVLGERWYRWADAAKLWVTMHYVDEYQRWGGYWLTTYVSVGDGETRPISRPMAQAPTYEAHPSTPAYRRGMQVAPAQRWENHWSNENPGVYGKDYWYVSQETLDYLKARGTDIMRLPFRWERIQPTLGRSLDSTELRRLQECVARAGNAGLDVIISVQNYAGYFLNEDGVSREYKIGSSKLPARYFYDLWKRLSLQFKNNEAVIAYDLMNEPHIHGGIPPASDPSPAKAWEDYSQKVVDLIRDNEDTKLLMIPGYAHIQEWAERHPRKWITDPADKHMYTVHHYFDLHNDQYERSYDEAVAYWRRRGY